MNPFTLHQQQQQRRRRQSSSPNDRRSRSKSPLARDRTTAANKPQNDNPFERAVRPKPKHDVLNRKVKGTINANLGVARARGYVRREETLGRQLAMRNNVSAFHDKRIGEREAGTSLEEKMLRRFQKVRSKQTFNLNEEDEGGEDAMITHKGRSLRDLLEEGAESEEEESDLEKMEDDDGDDDDDDEVLTEAKIEKMLEALKAGARYDRNSLAAMAAGEILETEKEERKRTRKEIMEDVIKKSRILKNERRRMKEDDEEERERLDAANIHAVLREAGFKRKDERLTKEEIAALPGPKKAGGTDDDDDYERIMKTLSRSAGEKRAPASDRTKTEEELAKEAREELEKLEEARIRRMHGEDEEEEEEDGDSEEDDEDEDEGGRRKRARRDRSRKTSSSMNASHRRRHEDEEEEEEDVVTDDMPYLIEAFSTHTELLEFLGAYPNAKLKRVLDSVATTNSIHLAKENRFKLERFCDVLLTHVVFLGEADALRPVESEEEESLHDKLEAVLDFIYRFASHKPETHGRAVGGIFLKKLQTLHRTFESHLAKSLEPPERSQQHKMTKSSEKSASDDDDDDNRRGGDWGVDDLPLLESSATPNPGEFPSFLAEANKKKGGHKGKHGKRNLEEEKAELERQMAAATTALGSQPRPDLLATSTSRCWPSPGDTAFFYAALNLFSVTDFRHPVATPCALLLNRYLDASPVRGPRDVAASVQVMQLVHAFIASDVGRFSPELVVGLSALFSQISFAFDTHSSDDTSSATKKITTPFTLHGIRTARRPLAPFEFLRRAATTVAREEEEHANRNIATFFGYDPQRGGGVITPALAHRLLLASFELLAEVARGDCARLPSFDAVFADLWISLGAMQANAARMASPRLRELLATAYEAVAEGMSVTGRERAALRMQHFAPTVKALTPKVQVSSGAYKMKDDKHRVQALKRSLKRERKGVARELRLDAQFVADKRRGETQAVLAAKKKQRKENLRFLELQQSDFNKAAKSGVKITGGGSGKRR